MEQFEPHLLLCGIDFSPPSQVALSYAGLLARAYSAQLEIVHAHHVMLPPYLGEAQWAAINNQLTLASESLRDEMQAFATPWLGDLQSDPQYLAMDDLPVDGILKGVAERRPDLVILGSHGRGRLSRVLMGSVSESVLREIDVPLLITRPQQGEDQRPPRIEHILCPVNYTEAATAGLRVAAAMAGRLGARLTLLHALETDGDVTEERGRLCQWVPAQVQVDCAWEAAPVVRGPAAERIVEAAEEHGAGLIVVGGRRRPFLTASIFGATTVSVVRHAHCPVLTVGTA
jgi:nucleotide-binding universal stress UspA family protein